MGQQIRKVTKRRRRIEYLKRKKEQSKLNSNAPIRLAVAVAKDAKPAAKEAPAKKTAAKAPAKKTETKAAAAKKAPAKKPGRRQPPPRANRTVLTNRRAIARRFFVCLYLLHFLKPAVEPCFPVSGEGLFRDFYGKALTLFF